MTDPDLHRDVADLRDKVSDLDGTVRVTTHAVANLQMAQTGIAIRLDKFEERIVGRLDVITEKLAMVNSQQARGMGFFAGIAFAISVPMALLLALARVLFGHGA